VTAVPSDRLRSFAVSRCRALLQALIIDVAISEQQHRAGDVAVVTLGMLRCRMTGTISSVSPITVEKPSSAGVTLDQCLSEFLDFIRVVAPAVFPVICFSPSGVVAQICGRRPPVMIKVALVGAITVPS
jgi:hypothetical protein